MTHIFILMHYELSVLFLKILLLFYYSFKEP